MIRAFVIFALCLLVVGCSFAPRARFSFSDIGRKVGSNEWLDVDQNEKSDFALGYDAAGNVDRVQYDDNEDGTPDRVYRLADYADDDVPHVVLLLDSLPYQVLADRYAAGDFRWFHAPVKMIAPFPSITEICYTELFHAPPLPGVIDTQFDPRLGQRRSRLLGPAGRTREDGRDAAVRQHAGKQPGAPAAGGRQAGILAGILTLRVTDEDDHHGRRRFETGVTAAPACRRHTPRRGRPGACEGSRP